MCALGAREYGEGGFCYLSSVLVYAVWMLITEIILGLHAVVLYWMCYATVCSPLSLLLSQTKLKVQLVLYNRQLASAGVLLASDPPSRFEGIEGSTQKGSTFCTDAITATK